MRVSVVLSCLQALALEATLTFAQTSLALPGCEPAAEVRSILEEKLSGKEFDKLKFTEQMARRREVLGDLIAKYPREVEPHRQLIQATRWWDNDRFPTLREGYVQKAAQHPDDPLALYLAGVALIGKDSPTRVRLLEQAKAKGSQFPWPALELAFFYSGGKRVDKQKASENIAAFFHGCPDSADREAQRMLAKAGSTELQTRVATALRARLAKESSPRRLKEYETLWGLEFRTLPPQEHDALRKQLAQDLQRLESLNRKPDAEWLAFLRNGYKQSGAGPEAGRVIEDPLMREFPGSAEVFEVENERWRKDHKEPEDHKDTAAWAKYQEDHKRALKRWIAQFRDAPHTPDSWFYVIYDDDSIAEQEGIDALSTYLAGSTEYDQPSAWNYTNGAEFLMNHKWQPERAMALLRRAQPLLAKDHEQQIENDNRTPEDMEETATYQVFENQYLAGLMLRAATLAGKADAVETLRASIEGPPPKQKKNESDYWLNRGRLAALDGHKTDALAYYQSALRTRLEPARYRRGKLRDDMTDEARALWKDTGGTETAWALWSQPPAKGQELAEGRWEKAKKTLPPFEMADLSGKTWRLKSLEGKSVLINVWATWCGPCQSEQPKLQKLYDQVKDRSDVQILTFNIDEDAGLVAPFLKEKGYTFPVVVAYNYVNSLLDSIGIPQNWIVDPKGAWRWTQLGFDSAETDWPQSMLQRLESVKN
jgi:thiol-disulfide isomerase/thioredoxin